MITVCYCLQFCLDSIKIHNKIIYDPTGSAFVALVGNRTSCIYTKTGRRPETLVEISFVCRMLLFTILPKIPQKKIIYILIVLELVAFVDSSRSCICTKAVRRTIAFIKINFDYNMLLLTILSKIL